MNKILFTLLLSLITISTKAQHQNSFSERNPSFISKKGKCFLYWGYNRSSYSKSTIHFSSKDYEFTIFDATASDRPTKFGLKRYFAPSRITIPQYNYRVGYFLSDRLIISGGLDHMKYVLDEGQKVLISGVISEEFSAKYGGSYLKEEIALTEDFLKFEHTDGLNLLTLDFEYLQPIFITKNKKFQLDWNIGLGGIWVVTRTDIRVMGDGINNDFHVAGFSLAAKTGPRFEFFNRIFFLIEFKSGYMTIPDVLIENAAPKSASHTIIFFEGYFAVGTYFKLGAKTK